MHSCLAAGVGIGQRKEFLFVVALKQYGALKDKRVSVLTFELILFCTEFL